jgi:L-ascorbate metabolism protein UlaG (beta-lactamase superfamily)
MQFTYYGHSCFSVKAGGKTLLFDPFVTANSLASDIDVDKIAADYIFVSHGHYDHTTDVIRIAKRTGAKVPGNWGRSITKKQRTLLTQPASRFTYQQSGRPSTYKHQN